MITSEQLNKRKQLMHLLRHKEEWPAGFEWNFNRHDGCAIGLAAKAGLVDIYPFGTDYVSTIQMREAMGFTWLEARRIFLIGNIEDDEGRTNPYTTPDFVASMIEQTTRLNMLEQGEANATTTL